MISEGGVQIIVFCGYAEVLISRAHAEMRGGGRGGWALLVGRSKFGGNIRGEKILGETLLLV